VDLPQRFESTNALPILVFPNKLFAFLWIFIRLKKANLISQ